MKVKIQFTTILPLLFLILTFSSCKKYEEGPVTLRTPKNRLTDKDWVPEERIVNGKSVALNANNKNVSIKFSDDGVFTLKQGTDEMKGTWVFTDKKEKITATLMFDVIPVVFNYTIKKLTNDELWVEDTDEDGTKTETHYKKKD